MTSFKNLFKMMQVPKLKNASLVYLLQVIGMIAIGSFLFFNDHLSSLAEGFFLAEFITLFFTGLFLYFYLLYKEIKSYESQTWQLMPISSAKFYLTNQLTTYLAIALFLALQAINGIIILGTYLLSYSVTTSELSEIINSSKFTSLVSEISAYMISIGIFLVLAAISFVVMIILLVMISQVIINLLPGFKSKGLVNIVRIIIGIICYLIIGNTFSFIFNSLLKIKDNPFTATSNFDLSSLWMSNGVSVLVILVITAINLYLLKRFFEAKAN